MNLRGNKKGYAAILRMSKGNKLELDKQIFILHEQHTFYNISNYKLQIIALGLGMHQYPRDNATTGSIAMLNMKMHEHAFFPVMRVHNLDLSSFKACIQETSPTKV